jgi:hypothetical protein
MNFIITIFSLIGLVLTLYQKFITLLYLSSKTLWDNVYEVKTQMTAGPLGMKSLMGVFGVGKDGGGVTSKSGGGLDAIITFLYGLLPNIKAYCDYNPAAIEGGEGGKNLKKEDGVAQYMMKTALPTICLIFFLTIGFSGTMAKAYGVVVDGMAVAADRAVEMNFAGWVSNIVGQQGGYDFQYTVTGTNGGAYTQRLANNIFNHAVRHYGTLSDEAQLNLGRLIEDALDGEQRANNQDAWIRFAGIPTAATGLASTTSGIEAGADTRSGGHNFMRLVLAGVSSATREAIENRIKSIHGVDEGGPVPEFFTDEMISRNIGNPVIFRTSNRGSFNTGGEGIYIDLVQLAREAYLIGADEMSPMYLHIRLPWQDSRETGTSQMAVIDNARGTMTCNPNAAPACSPQSPCGHTDNCGNLVAACLSTGSAMACGRCLPCVIARGRR